MKICTVQTVSIRVIAAAATVAAGFVVSGCATTHVGDDWQCPLIQGVPCQSVVEADPAGAGARQSAGALRNAVVDIAADERPNVCDASCRPFGWLRRALAGRTSETDEAERAVAREPAVGVAEAAEPDKLRVPEVIGRIWIAPYVDDAGVYHEASWVRAVLQPARWRLP